MADESTSVQIAVRMRPFNDREKALGTVKCVQMEGQVCGRKVCAWCVLHLTGMLFRSLGRLTNGPLSLLFLNQPRLTCRRRWWSTR